MEKFAGFVAVFVGLVTLYWDYVHCPLFQTTISMKAAADWFGMPLFMSFLLPFFAMALGAAMLWPERSKDHA